MARRNISLPDELDAAARDAGLNVSALAQAAIERELDRRARMTALDALLDELDRRHGPPSEAVIQEAEAWLDQAKPVSVTRPGRGRKRAAS